MLLLQVMMVVMFKYTDEFNDSSDANNVTLATNDEHHIQGCRNQAHNQCLQLKIRTKNVKNRTKTGPNFSEKSDQNRT